MKLVRMLTHKIKICFADFADLFLFSQTGEAGNSKRGSYH
jgi:hypothetical protein